MSGALRETQEELGIDPARIEVLGEIGPPEINLGGDMTVWPFVASLPITFIVISFSSMCITGLYSPGLHRKSCSWIGQRATRFPRHQYPSQTVVTLRSSCCYTPSIECFTITNSCQKLPFS